VRGGKLQSLAIKDPRKTVATRHDGFTLFALEAQTLPFDEVSSQDGLRRYQPAIETWGDASAHLLITILDDGSGQRVSTAVFDRAG
jgi:hypothetical protein